MVPGHHGRIAGVVVPGGSRSHSVGPGVLQHRLGIVGPVPVVVIDHHLGVQVRGGQRRPQRICKEGRLLGGRHQHAAVSGRGVERLIHHAQRIHRHPGSLVALNGLHQVAGKG